MWAGRVRSCGCLFVVLLLLCVWPVSLVTSDSHFIIHTVCSQVVHLKRSNLVSKQERLGPFTSDSHLIHTLCSVFVWGFGVLFWSRVCVSVSGVLFSLGVCV